MKVRAIGSLLLGVVFVFGADQGTKSAGRSTSETGLAGVAQQRPDAFIPGLPTVVSSPLKLAKAIPIPGLTLGAVDIFWVEESTQRLYIADRTNGSVDIIDTSNDTFVTRVPGFGPRPVPATVPTACNGCLATNSGSATAPAGCGWSI